MLQKNAQTQFSKYRVHKQSALSQHLWEYADWLGNRYFENRGRVFFWHLLYLLTDRPQPSSSDQNTVKTALQPIFAKKAFVLYVFYLLWAIPIFLLMYDSIFLCRYTEIGKKENFFGATLCTRKFTRRNFLGLASTEPLRTQDSENILALGDQASIPNF